MNVAVYTRVSTEDQAKEGYSLEVQREYLESFALREGYEVFRVYSDDGIGAYSTRRPALQQLLADARAKKFELVLVHKIDRFSRNLKDLLMLVDELSSYGVAFKSATEPFDTSTSAGKLMFQQLGSFAEFERNRIAERVFPGMMKGVQQGNWQGARFAPFGYTYNKRKIEMPEISRDKNRTLMLARDNSVFPLILKKIKDVAGATIAYSMWDGYLSVGFRAFCKSKRLTLEYIHTSGHAKPEDLKTFVSAMKPRILIPIHTFDPNSYHNLFKNVRILTDGEVLDI